MKGTLQRARGHAEKMARGDAYEDKGRKYEVESVEWSPDCNGAFENEGYITNG